MKNLKFRQWNNGKFHYWGYIDDDDTFTSPFHGESQQFTGLLDKQGNEIYEGDLLTYPQHKGYYQIRWLCDDSDCGFVCERKEPYNYMLPTVWGKMKVVSNICKCSNLLDTKTEKH